MIIFDHSTANDSSKYEWKTSSKQKQKKTTKREKIIKTICLTIELNESVATVESICGINEKVHRQKRITEKRRSKRTLNERERAREKKLWRQPHLWRCQREWNETTKRGDGQIVQNCFVCYIWLLLLYFIDLIIWY